MSDKNLLTLGTKAEGKEEDGGSESEPSEDNMEEEEMAKIIPMKSPSSKKKLDTKK